jgi:hypothetical protein
MVVNFGCSSSSAYVNAVDTTDISYDWWQGEAIIGGPQEYRKTREEKRKSRRVEL